MMYKINLSPWPDLLVLSRCKLSRGLFLFFSQATGLSAGKMTVDSTCEHWQLWCLRLVYPSAESPRRGIQAKCKQPVFAQTEVRLIRCHITLSLTATFPIDTIVIPLSSFHRAVAVRSQGHCMALF